MGPPGVGKSQAVEDAARDIAKQRNRTYIKFEKHYGSNSTWIVGDNTVESVTMEEIINHPDRYFVFVDLRLVECEPSDLSGFPQKENGWVSYNPLEWAVILSMSPGVLFLDELTNVQRPDVITAAYKLTRDRMAGFTKFHDDVLVIAAGNDPEHSEVANMLPTPLVDRIRIWKVEGPTVEEWRRFMEEKYTDEWEKLTYAFMKAFETENYLLRVPRDLVTLSNFATPRSWTELALSLHDGFNSLDDILTHVGGEVGQRFYAFMQTRIPTIDELLRKPKLFSDFEDLKDGQGRLEKEYMSVFLLSTWAELHPDILSDCLPLSHAIYEVSKEFVALLVRMLPRTIRLKYFTALEQDKKHFNDLLETLLTVKAEMPKA